MSSIKLQGNANGTGILTIEAPDTNTDRSFEIPDTSGTFAMTNQIGRRNLIINGAMQVWQRGTTVQSDAGYIVDRFKGYSTDSGTANYALKATRQQDSALGLKGYCAEISLTNTGGGINYVSFGTRIEASSFHGVNSGDTMTFSFYLKRSQSADSDLTVWVKSALNGVDSYQANALNAAYETTVTSSNLGTFNSLSTSWTRYTVTFTVTDALITNGGAVFIENGSSDLNVTNTNALYRTTGWQLEVGSVATPFEHRSFGEELALCQRYYCKTYNYDVVPGTANEKGGAVFVYRQRDNNFCAFYFQHPVDMRAVPTQTRYSFAGTSGSATSSSTDFSTATNAPINGTAASIAYGTGIPADDCYQHLVLDAEL